LTELREKMTEKRARKAAEEAKEAKANELIRRKAGKVRIGNLNHPPERQKAHACVPRIIVQESAQIKEDLKNKQILKDLEEKRRGTWCSSIAPHRLLA
jgi:hypothetical protein